ncbi:MAG: four helix bundle protein [Bacteroidota bacterium]|nr:four helix bundle protein [Bacteroidota bacterium]
MLNIAEGSSRFSKADRRNFFVIARGSVFECVAIFDFMKEEQLLTSCYTKTFILNRKSSQKCYLP